MPRCRPLPETDLGEAATEIAAMIGSLAAVLEREAGLSTLRASSENAAATLSGHDDSTAAISDQRIGLRERLSELDDEQRHADTQAQDLNAAQEYLAATQTARTAAQEAAVLVEQLDA